MKIRVFKWSDSWVIQCPHCIYSRSFVAMASTHREAISKAHKHLRHRHTPNHPTGPLLNPYKENNR